MKLFNRWLYERDGLTVYMTLVAGLAAVIYGLVFFMDWVFTP